MGIFEEIKEKIREFLDVFRFGRGERIDPGLLSEFEGKILRDKSNFFNEYTSFILKFLKSKKANQLVFILENVDKDPTLVEAAGEIYWQNLLLYFSNSTKKDAVVRLFMNTLFDPKYDIDSITGRYLSDMYFEMYMNSDDKDGFLKRFFELYKSRIINRCIFARLTGTTIESSKEADILSLYYTLLPQAGYEKTTEYLGKILEYEKTKVKLSEVEDVATIGFHYFSIRREMFKQVNEMLPFMYRADLVGIPEPAGSFVIVPNTNKMGFFLTNVKKPYIFVPGSDGVEIYEIASKTVSYKDYEKTYNMMLASGYTIMMKDNIAPTPDSDYVTQIVEKAEETGEDIYLTIYGVKPIDYIKNPVLKEKIQNIIDAEINQLAKRDEDFFTYLYIQTKMKNKTMTVIGKLDLAKIKKFNPITKKVIQELVDLDKPIYIKKIEAFNRTIEKHIPEEYLPNVDSFIYFMHSTKLWKELENIDNRIKSFPKFVITFFEDSNFRKKMLEYLLNRKSIKHKDDLVLFYPYKEEIDDFLRQS